jgi:SAM-dependent methyltransferase
MTHDAHLPAAPKQAPNEADGTDRASTGMDAAGYRPAEAEESARGNRQWWDAAAEDYHAEHGAFLGRSRLVWGPEGLDEAEAGLLGPLAGLDVLELGAGAAAGAAWAASCGARTAALDLSLAMLRRGEPLGPVGAVQADARRLPFAADSFDLVFSAYGALPFVADPEQVHAEVARVLRPGGRWAFSVTHPVRWAFPDDPGDHGLRVHRSYFDRTPYVETAADGTVLYAEHHRTIGDRVRELAGAGFGLEAIVEPEWPDANQQVWGGWSPLRGRVIPGTAIFVSRLLRA